MKQILFTILSVICLFSAGCAVLIGNGEKNMNSIFSDMETAIRNEDENLFKKHWLTEAYEKNTVGRSGLEGKSVFKQGSRKKWFPKPDFSKTEKVGEITIVPAQIWSWERNKSVDEVFFAVQTKNEPQILGGGEDLEEIRKLAARADEGKSLTESE